jgi:hypothetical protein
MCKASAQMLTSDEPAQICASHMCPQPPVVVHCGTHAYRKGQACLTTCSYFLPGSITASPFLLMHGGHSSGSVRKNVSRIAFGLQAFFQRFTLKASSKGLKGQ